MAEVLHLPWIKSQEARLPGELRLHPHTRALYHFDEGAGMILNDASIYRNHGALAAAPGTPTWVTGLMGYALSCDGVDDQVTVPHTPSLHAPGWPGITIGMYIWPDTQPIINSSVTFKSWDWRIRFGAQAANTVQVNSDILDSTLASAGSPPFNIPKWQWSHIVRTQEPYSGRGAIYYNGVQQGADIIFPNLDFADRSAFTLAIGSGFQFYMGYTDELYILNRAKTPSEVLTDFNRSPLSRLVS